VISVEKGYRKPCPWQRGRSGSREDLGRCWSKSEQKGRRKGKYYTFIFAMRHHGVMPME
jgi:hypothetical protein